MPDLWKKIEQSEELRKETWPDLLEEGRKEIERTETIETPLQSLVLTEKYRPKIESDLVGNERAIAQLKDALQDQKNCVIYGPPGVGKTSSIGVIAKLLGYAIQESNASDKRKKMDMESLLERVRARGFRKHLYLLDEADGLKNWSMVEKIITNSKHPIILIANDLWLIPKKIQSLCVSIRFYKPRITEVKKRIQWIAEKEGINAEDINYAGINEDIRSSINSAFYSGIGRKLEDQFGKIDAVFRKKIDPSELEKKDLIWILDNLHNYYKGHDLFKAMKITRIAIRSRPDVLRLLPKGSGKVDYPYYLRRIKVLKGGNAKKDNKRK